MTAEESEKVVYCKMPKCSNAVAKMGRICDSCYLKLPGGRKKCDRCGAVIHARQTECAKHMLDSKGGITRRRREPIARQVRIFVYERDAYTCRICGLVGVGTMHTEKIKGFEIDHIIPAAAGADSSVENLQVLCRKCNNAKRHYRV